MQLAEELVIYSSAVQPFFHGVQQTKWVFQSLAAPLNV